VNDNDVIDHEPIDRDPEATALALRRPDIPVHLSDLAALRGEGVEIIEARAQILETLRRSAIRATSPEDWILFKSPDDQGGQVIGYLQDAGADRVRDLWGIEVYGITKPEKVTGNDPAVFHYLVTGSGRCKLTRQVVEDMEGGRSSTDDFCRGKSGAELELLVRKAARANLDGNITRELAGMKSVPLTEIEAAWVGTPKKIEHCRKGRGFGTRDERVGGRNAALPDVDPPICPHCQSKGVYRKANGDRPAFYGCPNYGKHPNDKFIVNAAEWEQKQRAKAAPAAPAAAAPATNGAPAGRTTPPAASEIFGREPGQEG
jgi:hypothetical protein